MSNNLENKFIQVPKDQNGTPIGTLPPNVVSKKSRVLTPSMIAGGLSTDLDTNSTYIEVGVAGTAATSGALLKFAHGVSSASFDAYIPTGATRGFALPMMTSSTVSVASFKTTGQQVIIAEK